MAEDNLGNLMVVGQAEVLEDNLEGIAAGDWVEGPLVNDLESILAEKLVHTFVDMAAHLAHNFGAGMLVDIPAAFRLLPHMDLHISWPGAHLPSRYIPGYMQTSASP